MTTSKQNSNDSVKKFKEKMKAQGKAEIRGAYALLENHQEIKRLIRLYDENRDEMVLFLNKFEH